MKIQRFVQSVSVLLMILLFMSSAYGNVQLYVFGSESLPKKTIIEVNRDLKKIDGVMVFRGLKNNSFKDVWEYFINKNIDKFSLEDMVIMYGNDNP